MAIIKILTIVLFTLSLVNEACSQVTKRQTQKAAQEIGKWLSRTTGHYDMQSATSVNPKRAGNRFFGIPDMQTASDYGISYTQAPRTDKVTKAYETIGADTSHMASALKLPRFHLNLGFANKHDFNFSYLIPNEDKVEGWGVGYKRVIAQSGHMFFSYRLGFSRSSRKNYFEASSLVNDFSVSLYLRLIDFYAGVRHWSGKVSFEAEIPELVVNPIEYFSNVSELQPYVGVIMATTTNTRFTVEASSLSNTYSLTGKFSFHFDSLLPTFNNWFRDPRYIKQ